MRKLRFLMILFGLAILAVISTLFGMMMAVAADVPQIENQAEFHPVGDNSYLYDDRGRPIGIFAAQAPEVIDTWKRIPESVIRAVIAVEDKRFWTDPGVDIKGIVRAFISDISGGPTQGASTITEQFVKNALQQQGNRTILEKVREAALAFHLTREWKPTKILTEYLNSVYFGNGAYGIESAARVYFGKQIGYDPSAPGDGRTSTCGDVKAHLPSCASKLTYWQAAVLAGIISDPTAYDPILHRRAAIERADLVLNDMFQQGYISARRYRRGRELIRQHIPTPNDLEPPTEPAAAPYFASWLQPQIIDAIARIDHVSQKVAEYRAYYGGLKIRTSLDLKLQQAADQAVSQILPYNGAASPVASLVTIDNATGEVRAMVGGPIVNGQEDYSQYPFNLASQAERQPGSSFKPFTLAVALESGFGPSSVLLSAPANFVVPHTGGKEIFHVKNFGNTYSGPITLQEATDISDNSVFSRLGIQDLGPTGTTRVAKMAMRAGIRTPVSHNDAMILGGLTTGVSPLDMAHAYETFADGGKRVFNPILGDPDWGPTGIAELQCPNPKYCGGHSVIRDHPKFWRVMPAAVAHEVGQMLTGVVQSGTGTAAQIAGVFVAGKTGTTTNYADAWFVGWTPQLTTAVWVGFPNKLVPMSTLFNGGPVEGGTFPALIWHTFMVQALQILASEQPAGSKATTTTPNSVTVPTASTPTTPSTAPAATTTTGGANAGATGTGQGGANPTTQPPAPAPPQGGTGGGTGGNQGGTGGGTGGGGGLNSGGAGVGGGG